MFFCICAYLCCLQMGQHSTARGCTMQPETCSSTSEEIPRAKTGHLMTTDWIWGSVKQMFKKRSNHKVICTITALPGKLFVGNGWPSLELYQWSCAKHCMLQMTMSMKLSYITAEFESSISMDWCYGSQHVKNISVTKNNVDTTWTDWNKISGIFVNVYFRYCSSTLI